MKQRDFFVSGALDEALLHIDKIKEEMKVAGSEAMLVSSNVNVFYSSGRFFRGYTYIPLEGNPLWFIIRPNDFIGTEIHYIRKPEQIPDELSRLAIAIPGKLALELDSLTWNEAERLRKIFPDAEISNASPLLKNARMVKTDEEIRLIAEDGKLHSSAYREFPTLYKAGMTDVDFQIETERLLRQRGCLGYSRKSGALMEINMGSVLNGPNADTPTPYDFAVGGAGTDASLPVGADGTVMKPGTTVMVDMNGAFNAYQSDTTRTWSIGEAPAEAIAMHECSRTILRALEKLGKPGIPVAALYEKAMEIVKEKGFEKHFMGYTQQAGFIGHGVGLELNELPVVMARSKHILAQGMVLALEPKFIVPGVGAVGIENTYVVTPEGLHNLTSECPEELLPL